MYNIIIAFLFLLGSSNAFATMLSSAPRTFPSLPTQFREHRFKEIQLAFDERAKLFLQGRPFHNWKPNRPNQEIVNEFKHLDEWRHHTWYSEENGKALVSRPDFMVAQDLLEKGYFKRPHLLAFAYNQTDGSYNSSTIVLNNQRFLAMEAPSTPTLTQNFFNLLQNFQVTHLVRLTPATEDGHKKSEPYWSQKIIKDPKTNEVMLKAPFAGSRKTYPIRYYVMDTWKDHRGVDPKILLATIQSLRKTYQPESHLIACHCSGGVGRTGTFLAALMLLQEIDRQLASGVSKEALDISIEKIVLQLSLQRVNMVARAEQYLTLYRLIDLYVTSR